MWQQATADPRVWEAALSYCENLTLASQSDWRLPNIKELGLIVDRSQFSPAIDTTAFPGIEADFFYWSSTAIAYYESGAWRVPFDYGFVGNNPKSASFYVRCVRGGQ